jgi:hypothetical protein
MGQRSSFGMICGVAITLEGGQSFPPTKSIKMSYVP